MTTPVYSHAAMGLVTGDHFVEDIRIRVGYRDTVPINEHDYLRSRDLHRAAQQGLIKLIPYAAVPQPMPGQYPNLQKLEHEVSELRQALVQSQQREAGLGNKLDSILAAIGQLSVPQAQLVQAGNGGAPATARVVGSDVVGGEVPMFIPSQIEMGTSARLNTQKSKGDTRVDEAAEKLRALKKARGS